VPPAPLRHDHHRCRNRPTRGSTARPCEGRPAVLAAHILVPRSCATTARPPTPRQSAVPCPTRCGSAADGTSGEPSATKSNSGPRAHRLLGHRQPAPSQWSTRVQHPRTLEKIHDLLSQGVGLLDWSRRLDLALNTV
jgi:hypothetical protein